MPIWSEILEELSATVIQPGQFPDFDSIRRKYLVELHQHTERNVILYASGWLQRDAPPVSISINDEDMQAFMEVCHALEGENLI